MDTSELSDAIIGELNRRLCDRGLVFEMDRSVIEFRNNLEITELSFEYDNARMHSAADRCLIPLLCMI